MLENITQLWGWIVQNVNQYNDLQSFRVTRLNSCTFVTLQPTPSLTRSDFSFPPFIDIESLMNQPSKCQHYSSPQSVYTYCCLINTTVISYDVCEWRREGNIFSSRAICRTFFNSQEGAPVLKTDWRDVRSLLSSLCHLITPLAATLRFNFLLRSSGAKRAPEDFLANIRGYD